MQFNSDTQNKITGIVESIVYCNTSDSYTVIDVSTDGELITAVGILPEIAPGEKVILKGTWDNHSNFGRQFKVSEFERTMPENSAQYLKYLASGTIKGIGPKTAASIVDRFGDRTFDVIENECERLAVIRGISKEKAQQISKEFKKQFAVRKVIVGLEKYGLTPNECILVFKRFGMNAVELVKENPYILCGTINGINFDRAEGIASALEFEPNNKHRYRAGILYAVKHNLYNGHTCLPREKLLAPCSELLGTDITEIDRCIGEMINEKFLIEHIMYGREFVFLPDVYCEESNIASRMKTLIKFSPFENKNIVKDIENLEKEYNISYAQSQQDAISIAAGCGMMVLTGGPGTGKTTTVKGIIGYFESKGLEILLAAPTGRAAKRMSELTGYEAKTVHRLLEVEWNENDEPTFKKNMKNPLSADVIILDEVSMMDVSVFSKFLDAVRFGCRLILVGDADQLPAVGAGNVLHDIISSNIIPVVKLTEIFRQARESLIIMNAHAVISGTEPELDSKNNDFFFMERGSSLSAASTVCELATQRLPKAYGYSPLTDIQILCPSRKGDCGTVNLNARMQEILNPPDEKKVQCKINNKLFRTGDKVMQIKNNYDINWERYGENGVGIFNGDMGIIKAIDLKQKILDITFDDGKKVRYPLESLAELELAYAVTVHKSQGSEYDAVVIPIIDAPPQLMYRNLLYTALTRAKKLIIIVGSKSKFMNMIANDKQNKRYSALECFLEEKENSLFNT